MGLWEAKQWFPKHIHLQIPQVCDCATFLWQRDLTDGVKLRVFRWKRFPGLSRWAQCNHQSPLRWSQGCDDGAEVRGMRLLTQKVEEAKS